MAGRVASHTTMSMPDVYGVLLALGEEIIVELKNGAQVELGDLLTLYPELESEGVASPEDFNAGVHITKKGVRIRAKKSLIKQMAETPAEKAD